MTQQVIAPLRHVVIGVGAGIFKLHQSGLDLEASNVVGVADLNEEVGQQRADEAGCPFYLDHQKMLTDTEPDVAVIITPHPFHAPLAIDALNAGCHVLVEKPIAVQVAEADAMIEAAERNNRLLAVNFQQRFRPEVVAIRNLIQSGRMGDIQHVNMTTTWTRTARYFEFAGWRGTWQGEGGGVLMNQGPHNLDMLCHLLGQPSKVFAWTRTRIQKIETEDTVQAMFEWPNGAMGSLHTSTAEAGTPFLFELTGTGGVLRWKHDGMTFHKFEPDVRTHILESEEMYAAPKVQEAGVQMQDSEANHLAVYRNFHNAILNGTPVSADGGEARMSLELANAMIYSSHTGELAELPLNRQAYAELLKSLQAGS